jgi:DNA-binding NarL/FixJ family response regulator
VVLAEDHPAMAIDLHQLLVSEYDIVAVVQDGVALIDAARRYVPDAIVCDIGMPRMSGLAAAVAILATTPDARIVFVTVQDTRAVVRRALDLGARGYVLKCDAGHELIAAVRTAIDGGRYLSGTVRVALDTPGRSTGGDTDDVDD